MHQSTLRTRRSLSQGDPRFAILTCCLALALMGVTGLAFARDNTSHTRAFWQSIIDHEYAVPAGQSLPDLTPELTEMLGSPDPESRDEFA